MTGNHTGSRAASRTNGAPKKLRFSAPPFAGAAGRVPRSLTRHANARSSAFVIETKEVPMTEIYDIYAEIAEQRAELMYCFLTRKERIATQRRLDAALAEAARREREVEGA